MDPMIPAVLYSVAQLAGKLVDACLGESAPKLLSTFVGGFLGNAADRVVVSTWSKGVSFLQSLRTTDPQLNHDLERATREAYLVATLELVRQAKLRLQVATAASQLTTAGDADTLNLLDAAIQRDRKNVANTLPAPLHDTHLLLIGPEQTQQERLQRLHATLRANLDADVARWAPGRHFPDALQTLLTNGWTIDTTFQQQVPRDWYSLIAIAFVEKRKTSERLRAVFQSRMLAAIVEREPRAATLATFDGFTTELDRITAGTSIHRTAPCRVELRLASAYSYGMLSAWIPFVRIAADYGIGCRQR